MEVEGCMRGGEGGLNAENCCSVCWAAAIQRNRDVFHDKNTAQGGCLHVIGFFSSICSVWSLIKQGFLLKGGKKTPTWLSNEVVSVKALLSMQKHLKKKRINLKLMLLLRTKVQVWMMTSANPNYVWMGLEDVWASWTEMTDDITHIHACKPGTVAADCVLAKKSKCICGDQWISFLSVAAQGDPVSPSIMRLSWWTMFTENGFQRYAPQHLHAVLPVHNKTRFHRQSI